MSRTRFILVAFLLFLPVRTPDLAGQIRDRPASRIWNPRRRSTASTSCARSRSSSATAGALPRTRRSGEELLTGCWGGDRAGAARRRGRLRRGFDPIPPETEVPSSRGTVDDQRFLSTFDSIRRSGLDEPDDPMLWRGAVWGLIAALNDPYGQVLSPRRVEEFQEATTGNYAGIGVAIQLLNDQITVTAVFRDFPAERVGIQVGDVIVGVDGESAAEWTTGEASQRIRGTPGTMVTVSVERDGFSSPIPHEIETRQYPCLVGPCRIRGRGHRLHRAGPGGSRFHRGDGLRLHSARGRQRDHTGSAPQSRRLPGRVPSP